MKKSNQELIQEISNKIADLKKEKEYLKMCRLSECEFEKGEKVKVLKMPSSWSKDKEPIFQGEGFINRIFVNENGDFDYNIKKVKKDGTASAYGFYIYYEYKIEKI